MSKKENAVIKVVKKLHKGLGKMFIPVIAGVVALVFLIGSLGLCAVMDALKPRHKELVSVSTLERIINVSELSTSTAVYNGIAEIKDEKDPEKTDYFVSYAAKVKVGIDLEKVEITVDHEKKQVRVTIPEVYITDLNVDIASLDFIFYDTGKNVSTVTAEAYAACEEDVLQECESQDAVFDLARKSAVNVMKALLDPFVRQMSEEYTLVIE
ncbi:MAG: DUF4230 domain-containing protein [Clostridia bacterium]|nr:DUF4230 domain-containing protein [Clostridia bacterium]